MIKLSSGRSEKDRISFYTYDNGATAIRNDDGEITIELGKKHISLTKATFIIFGFLFALSIIKVYILIPLIKNATIGLLWYLVPTSFYLFLSIFAIITVRKTGGIELLKNHGAEHMVYSAYKKLKRIPTIEETKEFSRICPVCGINVFSSIITSQLIGFIVFATTDYKISEILLFLIPLFFSSIFPFNLIGKLGQFFTTAKPEDHNIELAIAALSVLESNEKSTSVLNNSIINVFNSKFTSNQTSEVDVDSPSAIDKWYCNGCCQYFDDYSCPGENNLDSNSENICPYFSPEI